MREPSDPDRKQQSALRRILFAVVCLAAAKAILPANGEPSVPASKVPGRGAADLRSEKFAWAALVVAAAISLALIWYALGARKYFDHFDCTSDLVLRSGIGAAVFACGYSALPQLPRLMARYRTSWWEPSAVGPDGSLAWKDVLQITIGGLEGDALTRPETFRFRAFLRSIPSLAAGTFALVAAATGVVGELITWRLPAILDINADRAKPIRDIASVSQNLTAYLALLAAGVSIVFTFRQLRAKVRADNRQHWINKARRLIAEIIDDAEPGARPKHLIEKRIRLELMLNPSEKDHRLMIYLVQRLSEARDLESISGARTLRDVVHNDLRRLPAGQRDQLAAVLNERDHGTLVSYIMRLSHVLLKREWQRVKETR